MSATQQHDVLQRLGLTAHRIDGVTALSVAGDLDLWTAPALCAAVENHFGEPLLLDLSELAFCDSTGLRALYGVAHEARVHASRLMILAPQRAGAARAFDLSGAGEFLPLAAHAQAALARLRRR